MRSHITRGSIGRDTFLMRALSRGNCRAATRQRRDWLTAKLQLATSVTRSGFPLVCSYVGSRKERVRPSASLHLRRNPFSFRAANSFFNGKITTMTCILRIKIEGPSIFVKKRKVILRKLNKWMSGIALLIVGTELAHIERSIAKCN